MALTKIGSIGINTGIQFAGVTTIATLNASDNVLSVGGTVNFVSDVSIGGTVSIAGTLTYEDVTNVDAVGLITARNGIVVGSGITLSKDGDAFFIGVTTATKFVGANAEVSGDLSGATGTFTGNVSIADKIIHTGDTNTALRFPAADTITAETGGSERARIDSSGNFLVRTTSLNNSSVDGQALQIHGTTRPTLILRGNADNNQVAEIQFADNSGSDDSNTGVRAGLIQYSHASNFMAFRTSATERLRIDSSGRLLIGTSSTVNSFTDTLQIFQNTATAAITVKRASDNAYAPYFNFIKSRGSTNSAATVLQSGDIMGYIRFSGTDGTDTAEAAVIQGVVDGTPGNNDMPGRLSFFTTADGAQNATERLQINSSGDYLFLGGTLRIKNSANDAQHGAIYGDSTSFHVNAGGILKLYSGGGERFRINSVGQVMIGTDTPTSNQAAQALTIALQNSGNTGITLRSGTGGSDSNEGSIFFSDATSGAGEYSGYLQYSHSGNHFRIGVNAVERYRIHSNGTMSWLNTTFPYNEHFHFYAGIAGKAGMSLYFANDTDEPGFILRHGRSGANSGAYTGKLFQFRNSSGNENGSIASNASVTAYNTSSDYRLKENEVTISDAISKVKQLKPYTFNFKVTPDQKVDGFFAHEAQEVIPYAVLGEKDAEDMQQMDYGKLTPLLTAALQEAITEIESLKTEVAALKSS